ARIDEIDGRTAHVNYPLGWAQAANTPLKRYKQNTHAGGIRTSMIMTLPGGAHAGKRSGRFQHVTDLVPTVLELAGLAAPGTRRGIVQRPIDGVSILPTLDRPDRPPAPRTQYFETDGHRAVWQDGWKAVAWHRRGGDFDDDVWELYHLAEDFAGARDLAAAEPERLRALVAAWWEQARSNHVLPLDDRGFAERANVTVRPGSPRDRTRFVYHHPIQHVPTAAAPPVPGRSYRITARVRRDTVDADGVLIAHGSVNSGYCLLVQDNHLVHDLNRYGDHHVLRSSVPVPTGTSTLGMLFLRDEHGTGGVVTLT